MKVSRYKVSTQKSIVFPYTCNETSKNEIKKNNFINNTIKKSKILRKKLNKKYKTYSLKATKHCRNRKMKFIL